MKAGLISKAVVGAAYEVHYALGPGLLERNYQRAMALALRKIGISVGMEVPYEVRLEGELIGRYFADLIAGDEIVVECKSAAGLSAEHEAQLLNYMRISKISTGYLINFRNRKLEFKRFVTGSV